MSRLLVAEPCRDFTASCSWQAGFSPIEDTRTGNRDIVVFTAGFSTSNPGKRVT